MPGSLLLGCMPVCDQVQRTNVPCHCNDRKSPGIQHALAIPQVVNVGLRLKLIFVGKVTEIGCS